MLRFVGCVSKLGGLRNGWLAFGFSFTLSQQGALKKHTTTKYLPYHYPHYITIIKVTNFSLTLIAPRNTENDAPMKSQSKQTAPLWGLWVQGQAEPQERYQRKRMAGNRCGFCTTGAHQTFSGSDLTPQVRHTQTLASKGCQHHPLYTWAL